MRNSTLYTTLEEELKSLNKSNNNFRNDINLKMFYEFSNILKPVLGEKLTHSILNEITIDIKVDLSYEEEILLINIADKRALNILEMYNSLEVENNFNEDFFIKMYARNINIRIGA